MSLYQKPFRLSVTLALLAAAAAQSHAGLTINPTWDPSVTSMPNATDIQAAFAYAAKTFTSLYTNDITINITVVADPNEQMGSSTANFVASTYEGIRSALAATLFGG